MNAQHGHQAPVQLAPGDMALGQHHIVMGCWAHAGTCKGKVHVDAPLNLPAGEHQVPASCDTCGQDYKVTATVHRP